MYEVGGWRKNFAWEPKNYFKVCSQLIVVSFIVNTDMAYMGMPPGHNMVLKCR